LLNKLILNSERM